MPFGWRRSAAVVLGTALLTVTATGAPVRAGHPPLLSPALDDTLVHLLLSKGDNLVESDCRQLQEPIVAECVDLMKKLLALQVEDEKAEQVKWEQQQAEDRKIAPALAVAKKGPKETCSVSTDSRGSGKSVVWSLCLKTSGHKHGSFETGCWGGTILWSRQKCSVHGRYKLHKDGKLIKAAYFGGSGDPDGQLLLADRFTFSCDGPGKYTFSVTDLDFTVGGGLSRGSFKVPAGGSISRQGC